MDLVHYVLDSERAKDPSVDGQEFMRTLEDLARKDGLALYSTPGRVNGFPRGLVIGVHNVAYPPSTLQPLIEKHGTFYGLSEYFFDVINPTV